MITGLMTTAALTLSGIGWIQLHNWQQYLNHVQQEIAESKPDCPADTKSPAPGCGRRDG